MSITRPRHRQVLCLVQVYFLVNTYNPLTMASHGKGSKTDPVDVVGVRILSGKALSLCPQDLPIAYTSH